LSQGAYLCTGSHDWNKDSFDLIVKPITVEAHVWLTARSIVAPGVIVREGAVLGLGSVATKDLKAWWIYQGCPALAVKERLSDC
jgi:putative colanic acid biosynthesis acetyltransferase WcaF